MSQVLQRWIETNFNGCVLEVLMGMVQCEVPSGIAGGGICEERESSSAAFSSFWISGSRQGQALPLTSALRCSEAGMTCVVVQDASGHGHHSTPSIFVNCRTRRSRKVSGAFSNSGAYGMGQPARAVRENRMNDSNERCTSVAILYTVVLAQVVLRGKVRKLVCVTVSYMLVTIQEYG